MLDKKEISEQVSPAVRPGKARQLTMLMAILTTVAVTTLVTAAQTETKPTEDLPAGPMQAKAIVSCQECHEARIIVQQRLGKAAWTKEVDKMIKWGAVVDANDHDPLIDYLSSNFGVDEPAYQPPRTSSARTNGGKTK